MLRRSTACCWAGVRRSLPNRSWQGGDPRWRFVWPGCRKTPRASGRQASGTRGSGATTHYQQHTEPLCPKKEHRSCWQRPYAAGLPADLRVLSNRMCALEDAISAQQAAIMELVVALDARRVRSRACTPQLTRACAKPAVESKMLHAFAVGWQSSCAGRQCSSVDARRAFQPTQQ